MSPRTSFSPEESPTQIVPCRAVAREASLPAQRGRHLIGRLLTQEFPRRFVTERPLTTVLIVALLTLLILRGFEVHIGDITINFGGRQQGSSTTFPHCGPEEIGI